MPFIAVILVEAILAIESIVEETGEECREVTRNEWNKRRTGRARWARWASRTNRRRFPSIIDIVEAEVVRWNTDPPEVKSPTGSPSAPTVSVCSTAGVSSFRPEPGAGVRVYSVLFRTVPSGDHVR